MQKRQLSVQSARYTRNKKPIAVGYCAFLGAEPLLPRVKNVVYKVLYDFDRVLSVLAMLALWLFYAICGLFVEFCK